MSEMHLRILLVASIFPPDIGGPATHIADLRTEMIRRGHHAHVLTFGEAADSSCVVTHLARKRPWPRRMATLALWVLRNGGAFDVIYVNGVHPAAIVPARLIRKPVVVKVVGDPAWERARRLGLTSLAIDEFQDQRIPGRVALMRKLRDWSLRRASRVVVPSRYLAGLVDRWTGGRVNPQVIPNGVSAQPSVPDRVRAPNLRTVFVGRLISHKRVDVLIEAVAASENVTLELIGEGPEEHRLRRLVSELQVPDRVVFRGALSHGEVMKWLWKSDVLLLASQYEGLPHVALEAMSTGTPVVAPSVGGIAEAVRHEHNGLLLERIDPKLFASALRRLAGDPAFLDKLSTNALEESQRWSFQATCDQIEMLLQQTKRKFIGRNPKAVFLAKTRIASPGDPSFAKKMEILAEFLETTLVGTRPVRGKQSHSLKMVLFPHIRPPFLGGLLFYLVAPFVSVFLSLSPRPSAIICQSPYEGLVTGWLARLVPRRFRPKIVVEVHGDWRTAARLYGARARRLLAPLADRAALISVLRADRVRVVSDALRRMVEGTGFAGEIDQFV
ncbi:MAG TPA: glycosyltransferase, partial [Actinomycetota bacterium]|nr:glycosyltransferase [Actinomycetota bacterium]